MGKTLPERRQPRPEWPGPTRGQTIGVYVASVVCLTTALVLLPYSETVGALIRGLHFGFLVLTATAIFAMLRFAGASLSRRATGRLAKVASRVPRPSALLVQADPLWDRWMDGRS
jgi:hypothetical protein